MLGLCLLLGTFLAASPPAASLHWCGPLAIQISPQGGGTGEVVAISVTLTNGLGQTLTVESITMTFDWTSTVYGFGPMTLAGGASSTSVRSVQLPSNAGDYRMTVSVLGQTAGDFFGEICAASSVFRVTASVIPYLAIGGIVIAAIVVSVILLGRRKPSVPAEPASTHTTQAPVPVCPVCGLPLSWIAPENRWYCSRCGQYR